jgi:hypothetical protein
LTFPTHSLELFIVPIEFIQAFNFIGTIETISAFRGAMQFTATNAEIICHFFHLQLLSLLEF